MLIETCELIDDLIHDLSLPYPEDGNPAWLFDFKHKINEIKRSSYYCAQKINVTNTSQETIDVFLKEEDIQKTRKLTRDTINQYLNKNTELSEEDLRYDITLIQLLNGLLKHNIDATDRLTITEIIRVINENKQIFAYYYKQKDSENLDKIKQTLYKKLSNYLLRKDINDERRLTVQNFLARNLWLNNTFSEKDQVEEDIYKLYGILLLDMQATFRELKRSDLSKGFQITRKSRVKRILQEEQFEIYQLAQQSPVLNGKIKDLEKEPSICFLELIDSISLNVEYYLQDSILKKKLSKDRKTCFETLKKNIQDLVTNDFRNSIIKQSCDSTEVNQKIIQFFNYLNETSKQIQKNDEGKLRNLTGSRGKFYIDIYTKKTLQYFNNNEDLSTLYLVNKLQTKFDHVTKLGFWDRKLTQAHKEEWKSKIDGGCFNSKENNSDTIVNLYSLLIKQRHEQIVANKNTYWFQTKYTETEFGKSISEAINSIYEFALNSQNKEFYSKIDIINQDENKLRKVCTW
ncbi:MAG: hypothetical protein LEGION0398_MBIBDBAK_01251 [Legionellaceae bacterium]